MHYGKDPQSNRTRFVSENTLFHLFHTMQMVQVAFLIYFFFIHENRIVLGLESCEFLQPNDLFLSLLSWMCAADFCGWILRRVRKLKPRYFLCIPSYLWWIVYNQISAVFLQQNEKTRCFDFILTHRTNWFFSTDFTISDATTVMAMCIFLVNVLFNWSNFNLRWKKYVNFFYSKKTVFSRENVETI